MGGLCCCCAKDLPDTNTVQDHKMAAELTVDEDQIVEFDLNSTGDMVLPTYPLKDLFAKELKRQIMSGQFTSNEQPIVSDNLNNLLSEKLKKMVEDKLDKPEIESEDEQDQEDSDKTDDDQDGEPVLKAVPPPIIPVISAKMLLKPQVWGIFGDWRDLNDAAGIAAMSKYNRESIEYCYDMDTQDNCKMRPSYLVSEYGDSSSWHGMYRFAPCETESFEFWRGNYATGVRGIIDPFDPDNPYGPQSSAFDMDEFKKQRNDSQKNISQNVTAATLTDTNLSKISQYSQIDITCQDIDVGCLYQKESAGIMGSILLSKSMDETHLEVPVCPEGIFFDDAVEALHTFTKGADLTKITSLKCHTNTWGLSANNAFAEDMVANMKSLTKFDLSDTVNYRPRSDLCMGIKSILMAAVKNDIEYINLSDNFLDMDGGRAFASFLAENKSLKILKVNKCSLGLKATEQIIEALSKNHDLNLTQFEAAGNDFCVDGMKQLIEIFEEMETLESLNMANCINPYKPHSGLKYLIQALNTNRRTLQYVNISGNTWNDDMECVEQIQIMLEKCLVMKSLNISCLGISKTGCKAIIKTWMDCAKSVWGLDCNLKELIWNKDLRCSPKTALEFAEKELPHIYNLKLKSISLQGVFRKLENRDKIRHALKNIDINCVLDGQWNQDETEEVSNTEYPEQKV